MAEKIVIYKKQTLQILNYKLEIFPPLIPNNFVLFRYNRVVNFHDSNVIADIDMTKSHNWSVDELFELLMMSIKRLNLEFKVVNDVNECNEFSTIKDVGGFRKIKSRIIRNYMKNCSMWALNHETILKIPKELEKEVLNIKFKSKKEYISKLVKVSYNIRVFLLDNAGWESYRVNTR